MDGENPSSSKGSDEDSSSTELNPYTKFLCNICNDHVRGGVITICGHLFCWTCLWPRLSRWPRPHCPRCMRRLILHEDIVPFLGEGPCTGAESGINLAQPKNVPRPTGMYLEMYQYPSWFGVNNVNDYLGYERSLTKMVNAMYGGYPIVMRLVNYLQWFMVLCIVVMFSICFYIMMFP